VGLCISMVQKESTSSMSSQRCVLPVDVSTVHNTDVCMYRQEADEAVALFSSV